MQWNFESQDYDSISEPLSRMTSAFQVNRESKQTKKKKKKKKKNQKIIHISVITAPINTNLLSNEKER